MVSEGETEMKLGARGAVEERQLDVDVVGARVNPYSGATEGRLPND